MRCRTAVSVAILGFLGSIGLAFAVEAPVRPQKAHATPAATLARGAVETSSVTFPNCPAPAVNGMNIRTLRSADGVGLTVFVVIQNVGNRAFFADAGTAVLKVMIGDRALGSFTVNRLDPSEVKFFAVDAKLPTEAINSDLVATLDFAENAPIGRVSDTLDCQTSDNRSVRKGQSLRASLDRVAG